MAQSGAVGFGPPWVGHVSSVPPRILPRPPPPPRPKTTEATVVGRKPSAEEAGAGHEAPGACGRKTSSPWGSPSSSSAYFSYSSTSSPPPSAGSLPFSPSRRPFVQNDEETKGQEPPPAMEEKQPPEEPCPPAGGDPYGDQGPLRRPSEGTATSVIRRRATVEVRSVAVQTPSVLMTAFDSRATYPRAKGHHHWKEEEAEGPWARNPLGGESSSLPHKKPCQWHCSFVGSADVATGEEGGREVKGGAEEAQGGGGGGSERLEAGMAKATAGPPFPEEPLPAASPPPAPPERRLPRALPRQQTPPRPPQRPTPSRRLQGPSEGPRGAQEPTPAPHRPQQPLESSPLSHWLSELRSSREDEEEAPMEEGPRGEGSALEAATVQLRNPLRGLGPGGGGSSRERLSNLGVGGGGRRRGSGGEVSVYEDACSCCGEGSCCGVAEAAPWGVCCGPRGGGSAGDVPGEGEAKEADCGGAGVDSASESERRGVGGGYKGIWGMDGAAAEGVVLFRGGVRSRGEGIEWRLSALGLAGKESPGAVERRQNGRGSGVAERRGGEEASYCRRTISEGMGSPAAAGLVEQKKKGATVALGGAEKDEAEGSLEAVRRSSSSSSLVVEKKRSGSTEAKAPSGDGAKERGGHEEEEEDWPRRSKFTEEEALLDESATVTADAPGGSVSHSDSFKSTSSESKLSSASSQEIPTTGYNSSNTKSSSSSCDNVSCGGEVVPTVPPRKKPPRKPKAAPRSETPARGEAERREPEGKSLGKKAFPSLNDAFETTGGKDSANASEDDGRSEVHHREPSETRKEDMRPLQTPMDGEGKESSGAERSSSGDGERSRGSVCSDGKQGSPKLVRSSSREDKKCGGVKASIVRSSSEGDAAKCRGSEVIVESAARCVAEEDAEDWKGVFVSGRRKGSYSSDIEAWKRGLSGWCSVEDEDEFLESTMFDPEDSSLSVGCGSPVADAERSVEEWYSSNDMEGRVYYFEENSNESSWTLPEVSVVSPPQTPPPAGVSVSPAGSDSFISGRSSGGEEGPKEMAEKENGSLVVMRDDTPMPTVKMIQSQWEKASGGRLIQPRDCAVEKELRIGRVSRAAKTRSMVIGDPSVSEVKVPVPGKIHSAKDWPQLWDGNMCVLREGTLNRTKITENGKRVRKNWASSHVVLTELFLLFFKDAKAFAAMKAGASGGGISPGDAGATPELCVDLNGALVDRGDQLSSRRNVFLVSTVLGLQVLCQDDNLQNAEAWFQDISKASLHLPSGFDGSPRQNTLDPRNFLEPHSPDEHKKFPRIGRSKSVKIKKDASMEDLSAASATERQVKIKARLKKFFHRRPTMESLVKKGIWKDEPAFGCYLEQVSGEGIPRIPLFVQRCIAAIESKPENMKADGLYRASGNLSQVQKIRLQVDQNNLSIVDMEEDVHVLTGALKLFFRELKEPLIPYSLFNRALTASTNPNRREQLHEFKEIVKILPVANYDTLKFLLQHLLRVTSYQESNRMHIANLAIVFGPTLMWPKQESLNMALDLMQQNLVIECLLQEFDTIFSSGR